MLAACELVAAAGLLAGIVLFLQTEQETVLASEVQVGDTVIGEGPLPAVAPFDTKQAEAYQEAWAKHLGTKVEIENSLGIKLLLIPPGEFMMGSPQDEIGELVETTTNPPVQDQYRREGPRHRVKLTQAFYLASCEVTQHQYQELMRVNPSHFSLTGPGKDAVQGTDTSQRPVETVSWFDAIDFCNKLSEKEKRSPYYMRDLETVVVLGGTGYRLPTEAEWEYACRAGTTTRWSFGNDEQDLATHGWFNANSISCTHWVGVLRANPFGMFDMQGNGWEWCWDLHGEYATDPVSDPAGAKTGAVRVCRGGGWSSDSAHCRSAIRGRYQPTLHLNNLGFRVAAVPIRQASEPAREPGSEGP